MSAPGPANINAAKGVLANVGLKDGDYTIDQLDMGLQVSAMKAGTFDAGYTIEPVGTMLEQMGVAKTINPSPVSEFILGDAKALAFTAGAVVSKDFIESAPTLPDGSSKPG